MSDDERAELAKDDDDDDDASDDSYVVDETPAPAGTELPEGVQKEFVTRGRGWKKPQEGDDVQVHYVGSLASDGSQFESSRDAGTPYVFALGKSQVKGWDLGVASMIQGEVAKFTLQPEYAYAEAGLPPEVLGGAAVVFEVELLGWIPKEDLFGDGGCIKSLLEEGNATWKHPKVGGEVLLSITATTEGGAVLQDVLGVDYEVGSGAFGPLDKVIDKTLLGMSKGERCSLACAKDYVFEGAGHGTVVVELHLQEIYSITDVSFAKDKSIVKKTLKEGEGHERPQDGHTITLKVDSVVDAAGTTLPAFAPVELSFEAGSGEVCDVLECASKDMKKGERALVTCVAIALPKLVDPRLGLSEVTAGKVLITMDLLEVVKSKEVWSMTHEERLDLALKRKTQGGALFSGKRFDLALEKYKKVGESLASLDGWDEQLKVKAIDFKKVAELNKAMCFLKVGDFEGVIASCDVVLKDERNNVKALFRRAKARHERWEHLEAQADLNKVLQLDASNREAKTLMQQVIKAQKLVDQQAKATYAKMCQGLG